MRVDRFLPGATASPPPRSRGFPRGAGVASRLRGVLRAFAQGTWYAYMPGVLLTLVAAVSMGWALIVAIETPYDGGIWVDRDSVVVELDPGGAAEAAGIRLGDRLLEIDGVPLERIRGLYRDKGIGDRVNYTLERRDREVYASLLLGKHPLTALLLLLEQLVVAASLWAVSLFAWAQRPSHRVTRLFYLFSQVGALTLALNILAIARWPAMLLMVDLSVLPLAALTLHFHSLFPEPVPKRLERRLMGVAYALSVPLLVLTVVDALADGTMYVSGPVMLARRVYIGGMLLGAIALLLRKPPQGASEPTRRRRRVLIAGLAGGLLPFLLLSFLPEAILGSALVDYSWTVPAAILWPMSFGYALKAGDLGRVDHVLNRTLVHIIAGGLLLGAFAGLWAAVDLWVRGPEHGKLFILATVMLFGVLFEPTRVRIQRWIDSRWYRRRYDYRSFVTQVSAELSKEQERDGLVARLMEIAERMRFRSAVFLWPEKGVLRPQGAYGPAPWSRPASALGLDGALVGRLIRHDGPVLGQELRAELADSGGWQDLESMEKALLEEPDSTVWLPLVSRGMLRALLVLGERQGEELLEAEDRDILRTLSGQAATAAENVALLESERQRVEQLRRAYERLYKSGEIERAHLARELHDGPVQDLGAVQVGLGVLEQLLAASEVGERFCRMQKRLHESLEDVVSELRAVAGELRPSPMLPFDLSSAIRDDAERFAANHVRPEIRLDLQPDGALLPEDHRLMLYRIYQEALRNVVKHAQATCLGIRLEHDGSTVVLEIRDDGRGFEIPENWGLLARNGHLGMLGISERAEAIGGRVEVESEPGKGTCVRAVVPMVSEWRGSAR